MVQPFSVPDLLKSGQIKDALDLGKTLYKRNSSPENRSNLISAYLARVDQFVRKNERDSARMTLQTLLERFPETRGDCTQRKILLEKDAFSKVEMILNQYILAEKGSLGIPGISDQLARELVHPNQIAQAKILPSNHPLKIEAKIIDAAFKSVTEGKGLTDFAELLTSIGRHSPFSNWRRAISAIDCFHKNEETGMNRHLSGIPENQPVAIIAQALRAITSKSAISGTTPVVNAFNKLHEAIGGKGFTLRHEITDFMSNLEKFQPKAFLKEASRILPFVQKEAPEAFHDICREVVATFFRQSNGRGEEEFFQILTELGIEKPEISLWIAMGIHHSYPRRSSGLFANLGTNPRHDKYFSKAEKAWLIRKAAEVMSAHDIETTLAKGFSSPWNKEREVSILELLKKSLELHYFSKTYDLLISEMDYQEMPEKSIENEVQKWHASDQKNLTPLLLMINRAREKKKIDSALQYIDLAEEIDPLHPEVRSARIDVLFESAENAIRRSRSDVGPTLSLLLKLLPEGDPRRLYHLALVWAGRLAKNDVDPFSTCPFPATMNRDALQLVISDMKERLSLRFCREISVCPRENILLFLSDLGKIARGYHAAGQRLSFRTMAIDKFQDLFPEDGLNSEELLALCKNGDQEISEKILFLLSRMGLRKRDHDSYKYLYYRALPLIKDFVGRSLELLHATMTLARQANDQKFLHQAQELISGLEKVAPDDFLSFPFRDKIRKKTEPLSSAAVKTIIEREINTSVDVIKPSRREEFLPYERPRRTSRWSESDFKQLEFEWEK